MARLFFDVVGPNTRQLDFSGSYYEKLEQAQAAAELFSLDLACPVDTPWLGAEVQVRDAAGTQLFACLVPDLHRAA
jgi:hypothetical protein